MKALLLISLLITFSSEMALAKKRGGKGAFAGGSLSFGLGLASTSATQDGINDLIQTAKATEAATVSTLSSGLEYVGHATFRFSNGFVALQLRPSYFTQEETGTGTLGNYEYSLSGLAVFPLVRIIPLSNDFIDFYMQGGIGYANLSGTIKTGPNVVDFSGGNFGAQIGIGADFCFFPNHCFGVEGNYRYLPIPRNIVSSTQGTAPTGVSQAVRDQELEANNSDVATKLTGISGILMYTFNF